MKKRIFSGKNEELYFWPDNNGSGIDVLEENGKICKMNIMTIRPAQNTCQDRDLVFSLSNDPLVRSLSFNTKPIEYEEHCKWFSKTVSDPNTLFFLVFADDPVRDFVGQIRFKRETKHSTECVISLSITKDFRGKHIAKYFIELGIEEMHKKWYDMHWYGKSFPSPCFVF